MYRPLIAFEEEFFRIGRPEIPANLAWGDGDLRTLYITAHSSLYRIRLDVTGISVAAPGNAPEHDQGSGLGAPALAHGPLATQQPFDQTYPIVR